MKSEFLENFITFIQIMRLISEASIYLNRGLD